MKNAVLAIFLALLLVGTAAATVVDFRVAAFSDALNQPSFSTGFDGGTITVTATPIGARLWWDSTDGLGVQYSYERDEIESLERLRVGFSNPVYLSSILVTDLFNEGYLEQGSYQLNGSGNWVTFSANPAQIPGSTNGELTLTLGSNPLVSSILFRAPGQVFNQTHEFSVARIETVHTPIPAAVWLLGSGLAGLVALRSRRRKQA